VAARATAGSDLRFLAPAVGGRLGSGRPAAEVRATARGRRALPRVAHHRAPAPAVAGTPDVRVGRPLVHRDGAPVAAASAGGTPSARATNPRLDHRARAGSRHVSTGPMTSSRTAPSLTGSTVWC